MKFSILATHGFIITNQKDSAKQGGSVNFWCLPGEKKRYVFKITAENYFEDKEFTFEVSTPLAVQGNFSIENRSTITRIPAL